MVVLCDRDLKLLRTRIDVINHVFLCATRETVYVAICAQVKNGVAALVTSWVRMTQGCGLELDRANSYIHPFQLLRVHDDIMRLGQSFLFRC